MAGYDFVLLCKDKSKEQKMNNQRNSPAIILTTIVLLSSACGSSATPTPIPPTAINTPVAPTFTPILQQTRLH